MASGLFTSTSEYLLGQREFLGGFPSSHAVSWVTMDDRELVERYLRDADQAAFGSIVERYLGLVLGVARRRTGNAALAEEIAHAVFAVLARKAHRIKVQDRLAGWLYRTAMLESSRVLRQEHARQRNLKNYAHMSEIQSEGRAVWEEVLPHLDDALSRLGAADRDLILLRFYEQKSFREIGTVFGKTENAVQKQTGKVLRKLEGMLKRRGLAITGVMLASNLGAKLNLPASTHLARSIAQHSMTASPSINKITLAIHAIHTMTYSKLKIRLILGVLVWALLSGGSFWLGTRQVLNASLASADEWPGAIRNQGAANNSQPNAEETSSDLNETEYLLKILHEAQPGMRFGLLGGFDPVAWRQSSLTLRQLRAEQIPAALKLLQEFPGGLTGNGELVATLLGHWAESEGETAMAYAMAHLPLQSRFRATKRVMLEWAKRQPQEAFAWFQEMERTGEHGTTAGEFQRNLWSLFQGWGAHDWSTAVDAFSALLSSTAADPNGVAYAFEGLLELSRREDPNTDLLDWTARLPETWIPNLPWIRVGPNEENNLRSTAVQRVMRNWGPLEPARAAAWYDGIGSPVAGDEGIASSLYHEWRHIQPAAAADWYVNRSGSADRADRLQSVLENWGPHDPEAVEQWVGTLDLSAQEADAAAQAFTRVYWDDMERSAAWLGRLSSPELRIQSLTKLIDIWQDIGFKFDAEQLEASGVSSEEFQQAMQQTTDRES